jgi:hypothetical protein
MSFLPSEYPQKQLPPGTVEPVFCWTCGKPYRGKLATDRRVHKLHHRRALTARAALAGVGPRPLPVTRAEWAQLEKRESTGDPVEDALLQMWLEYARSLAPDYDVRRHWSWPMFVCIELGRDVGTSHEDQVLFPRFDLHIREALIARFGEPILYCQSVADLMRRYKRGRARR